MLRDAVARAKGFLNDREHGLMDFAVAGHEFFAIQGMSVSTKLVTSPPASFNMTGSCRMSHGVPVSLSQNPSNRPAAT